MSTSRMAIVTGAGKGIGAGIAAALGAAGYTVVAADRHFTGEPTNGIMRVVADITSPADRQIVLDQALSTGSDIAVLVNNAGRISTGPALAVDDAVWDQLFAVNVKAAYAMCQLVAPPMKARRCGSIVNIASIAAGQPSPVTLAYGATKAAMVSMTFSLAADLAEFGIRVNAVSPGLIDTSLTNATDVALAKLHGQTLEDVVAARRSVIPIGRIGAVEDVAQLVAFLASDVASFITGQAIHINGGSRMTGA